MGLARQGLSLARFFVQQGAHVTISDAASANKLADEINELADLPIQFALGGHPESLLDDCDLLCLSGGVPPQLTFVQKAVARAIPLTNDSLLTLQQSNARGLGPIVAITGSSGKTTTTTLVGEMLKASSKTVHVGGNIGQPLLDRLDEIEMGDIIILELSSFQLELFDPTIAWGSFTALGPDIAAVLNITPNHLDRHGTMEAYTQAKLNLLRHLPDHAKIVLNNDSSDFCLPALASALSTIRYQLSTARYPHSLVASREGCQLIYKGDPICTQNEVKLLGEHNIENLLAAAAISGAAGATPAAMGYVARTFSGVPHRLEVVSHKNGITWINDSIATSPERAVAGLRCFDQEGQTLILLAGGKDKNLPWHTFADETLARVDHLIGFGHAGPMIVNAVQEQAKLVIKRPPNCAVVSRLDEAVDLASKVVRSEAVVLLSPGGTSYDAYHDFEERGQHFRELVSKYVQ